MARDTGESGQIFLSYSRKDSLIVSRLAKDLSGCGLSAWLDVDAIHAGRVWREEIVTSIETCAAFVLVLSEHSAASENVSKELALAEASDRQIFPILLGSVDIPTRMKYQLAELQFIEIGEDDLDTGMTLLLRGFEEAGLLGDATAATARQQADTSFIGCARELEKLDTILEGVLRGRARPSVITGEAGSGKTALINAFQRRAQASCPELLVAVGAFSPATGYADPYIPWIEILRQIIGDVEVPAAHGQLTPELADRLRALAPAGVAALLDHGPGLIGDFLPAAALRTRAEEFGLLAGERSDELSARIAQAGKAAEIDKTELNHQYTEVLRTIAEAHPLLLIFDDMHWADEPSLDLLTHVRNALDRYPILILGACCPTELQTGPDQEPHPLMARLNAYKRKNRDLWIDLDAQGEPDRRAFVDGVIDGEPNTLDEEFREALFKHTGGNPLFTTELLRTLKDEGVLAVGEDGRLALEGEVHWDDLPEQVEGVVEDRISALEEDMREMLSIASVEGENFTAQVVARVQELHERDLLRDLSRELDKRHRLVREIGAERLDTQILSHFTFKHALMQRFLYDEVSPSEKLILHGEIGEILEDLYSNDIDRISSQLARHFDLAGVTDKAITYLTRAARRSIRMSAYPAARRNLSRAIELVQGQPGSPARDQHELDLQIMLSAVVKVISGWDSPDVIQIYQAARRICAAIGPTAKFAPVLFGFWVVKLTRLELEDACVLAQELRQLGQTLGENDIVLQGSIALGNTHFWMGNLRDCLDAVEAVYPLYDPAQHTAHLENYGQDPRALALMFSTLAAGLLGEENLASAREAELRRLIDEVDHPFTQAIVLQGVAWHRFHKGELGPVKENATALIELCTKHDFGFYRGVGMMFDGWADGRTGDVEGGIAKIEEGFQDWIATAGGSLFHSLYALLQADLQFRSGDLAEGIEVLQRGLAKAQRQNERIYEPELHRRMGETLRSRLPSCPGAALACLTRAEEIAHEQSSILFELRAGLAICQMMAATDRRDEAAEKIEAICARFPDNSADEIHVYRAARTFLTKWDRPART